MTIEKLSELLPGLTPKDLNAISSKSLNRLFALRYFSGEEFFIPKQGYLYIVKKGKVILTGFIEDHLEVNVEFKEEDCLGYVDLLLEDTLDFILKGSPSATLLEIPIKELMNSTNINFLLNLYDILIKTMMRNTFKLIKKYAAKANFSNEQYLIDFLIYHDGSYTYNSTRELAQLLHMDIRTLQRAIKKLTANKILEKNKKTLKISDMNSARKMIEVL